MTGQPKSIGESTKEWDNVRYEDKKNHTKVITETNKIRYRLTYADVWNLTYKVDGVERLEYKGEEGKDSVSFDDNTTTGDSSNIEINDLYQKNVNDVTTYPVDWKESGDKRGPTSRIEDWQEVYVSISTEEQDYTLVKDHVITTIIIKSGYKYSSGTTSVKEKTDKNYTAQEMESGNFSDPNFVKYYIYSTGVRNNISSMSSWLFEALENNSRTEGLVDITKYMLYKATDNDYGVTSIDFSAYNENDFKDVSDMTINDGTGGNDTNGTNENFSADGTLVEIAKKCHDYIRENNFYYSSATNKEAGKYVTDGISTGNGSIPYPNGTNYTDCSAYVTWVLYEYGYTEFTTQKTSSWFNGDGPKSKGWSVLPASSAQPGDILVTSGHVEIYVGDGTYAAGCTDAIRREKSYSGISLSRIIDMGGFTKAIRVTKP